MKLIADNKHLFEELYDQDDLLKERLGIVQHLKQVTNYHDRINTEDNSTQQREAKSFIKRVAKEREERERIKQFKQKQIEDKQKKDQEEQQKLQEEQQKRSEIEYKSKKQEILQQMKEKEEQRKKFRDETAVAVKQVMRAQPLYMVIEQKYKSEIELPELDQQKQKLKQLRSFYKPVNELGIDKHKKNYEIQRKQMENEIRKQRDLQSKSIREHVAQLRYKPHLNDFKDEEIQRQMEEQEKVKEEKKRIQEKVGNYAKYVKEMYWPKVSETKRNELMLIKSNLKTQPAQRVYSARRKQLPSLNDENYEDFMNDSSNQGLSHINSMPQLSSIHGYTPQHKSTKKKLNWGNKSKNQSINPESRSGQIADMVKSVDYLKDQRFKRDMEGKRPNLLDDKVLERYMNNTNLNDQERLNEIRKRAMHMEERAKMDEKLIRNSIKGGDPSIHVEKTIAVNDMYLEAIQAKLKILDQI
eukprot:403344795